MPKDKNYTATRWTEGWRLKDWKLKSKAERKALGRGKMYDRPVKPTVELKGTIGEASKGDR